MLEHLRNLVGSAYVLTGDDRGKWLQDWTGAYRADPVAVLRPKDTYEVAGILALANETATPVVPVSGNTGLTGATSGSGMWMISLDRLNQIEAIDAGGRTATVGAGVILSTLHDAADQYDLVFPMTFGARGSAMVGGILSTNAGGSNVLRYGNTRDLVLGLEAVMPDGSIMDLMGKLHKDNAGLNLKHLLIGAEGTLGVITRAVVKLFPKPVSYTTAMIAVPTFDDALAVLNHVQRETSHAVEAFEFMPRSYIEGHLKVVNGAKEPFDHPYDINLLIEIGATSQGDGRPGADGTIPMQSRVTDLLGDLLDAGRVLDAVIAQTEAQRQEMWARREAAAEIAFHKLPVVDTDISVGVGDVAAFLHSVQSGLRDLDPLATDLVVGHLGDGNLHYTAYPTRDDPDLKAAIRSMIDDVATRMQGSFSAEHGIGVSKLASMGRLKDPTALASMHAIKTALDPKGIMNPGKLYPKT